MGEIKPVIVKLAESHAAPVVEILNHYIASGFAAYFEQPVPPAFFAKLWEMIAGYPALVSEIDGECVGFAFLRPYHPAATMVRTAEITYFIHPDHVRKGLGTMLLDELISEAAAYGIDNIVASVSSRNEQSLAFHRKYGFVERGRLAQVGRKFDQDFDVVYMQLSL